jgi:hypothetical protein
MLPYDPTPVQLRDTSDTAGRMGSSLAMASVINDRALELIVGAPGRTGGVGGLLLYANPFTRDASVLTTMPFGSPPSAENFASSLAVVGDSDGDAASEFLVLHPGKLSGNLRSAVVLTEYYPVGGAGGFSAAAHTILTGATSAPTFTRALSASGALLDTLNTGRHSWVLTVEVTGVRALQSYSLSGGGVGMIGPWTAMAQGALGSASGYTAVIASR